MGPQLHVIAAQPSALQVLAATGAWDHRAPSNPHTPDLHQVLITTPAARAHDAHGLGELWGVRAEECRAPIVAHSTHRYSAVGILGSRRVHGWHR